MLGIQVQFHYLFLTINIYFFNFYEISYDFELNWFYGIRMLDTSILRHSAKHLVYY